MNFTPQNYSQNVEKRVSTGEVAQFMSRVYNWMMIGIFITAFISYQVANTPALINFIFGSKLTFWTIIILQFGAVIYLSAAIQRINALLASVIYIAYSALTGLTLSAIFFAYTQQSITSAFLVTAVSFGGLSAWGYITRRDLGPVGSFCMMGLFGLIGMMFLSYFFPSLMGDAAQKMMGIVGIIVFSGLTAYDTQRIKSLAFMSQYSGEAKKNAIYGAFMLYLDFLNLFLSILRLMGSRK